MHGICENQAMITCANIKKGERLEVSHTSMKGQNSPLVTA